MQPQPQQPRLADFWRAFLGNTRGVQVAIVLGACVGCSCLGTGGIAVLASVFPPVSPPTPAAAANITATATPTATPTPTPKDAPTPTQAPDGPPLLGSPISSFIATYGQPIGHDISGGDNFAGNPSQSIIYDADFNSSGTVTHIAVLGPDSWSNAQTMVACAAFLPSGTTKLTI
jgi:hypothetical protein